MKSICGTEELNFAELEQLKEKMVCDETKRKHGNDAAYAETDDSAANIDGDQTV